MDRILQTLINAAALYVAVLIVPNIEFTGEWWKLALVAFIFGLVNTFVRPDSDVSPPEIELARATETEKESQLARVRAFQASHTQESEAAIARLKDAAISGDNVFAVLMDAARVCSLQQVTEAFFEVGGQYRRNV